MAPACPCRFLHGEEPGQILAAHAARWTLSAFPGAPVTGAYFAVQEGHSAAMGDLPTHGFEARFGLMNLAMVRSRH